MSEPALVKALRSRGLRVTTQRQLVLDAVDKLGHATPEQIHAEVDAAVTGDPTGTRAATGAGGAGTGTTSTAVGRVNITTVYRTLDLLEELRLVTHTHLSHGAPTYHRVSEDRHLHLVCRRCQAVMEIGTELAEDLAAELLTRRGFVVDVEHLALFGLCADCSHAMRDADGYSRT